MRWGGRINWPATPRTPRLSSAMSTRNSRWPTRRSQAASQLQAMGSPLSAGERKTHADALFNAKRYSEASAEYNAIGRNNPQTERGRPQSA